MATAAQHNVKDTQLSGLARALVQHQRIDAATALELQKQTRSDDSSLVESLVALGKISAKDLASFASTTFGAPLLDLTAFEPTAEAKNLVDDKLVQEIKVIPLHKRGNRLAVGLVDPSQQAALDRLKFHTGCTIDPVVIEVDKLNAFLGTKPETTKGSLAALIESFDEVGEGAVTEMVADDENDGEDNEAEEAPVVKLLQQLLHEAIRRGASDLHFEPYEKFYRVRFRIDGILHEIAQPPITIKEKLASRIKIMSRIDISEKRVPQDGRMKLLYDKSRAIDFRVSTLPTLFGEKIVMRILDPSSAKLGIDALGYDPEQKAKLMEAIHRPYGMVLVTGPTGSGKTVSLYSCLNILNQPGINISTAEDPAEINLPGINQVNVNDKAGLTFASALKSFLRQDPDIIMVGEIRDLETADIAIKAAQTGHLVFSTLHTNDAPTTLTRLMNMGVAPFNIASSVSLITAQRLARKLCKCKRPSDMSTQVLLDTGFLESDLDGSWQPYEPVGCETCGGSGYKGRVGIYQVMPVSGEMQKIILNHGNAVQIAEQAEIEGVASLRRAGLLKVKQGMTSIDEVLGVTNQ